MPDPSEVPDDRAALYRRLPLVEADRWWADLARAAPDRRVLELGAGTGRLTVSLRDVGVHVTAVDGDRGMLAALREQLRPDDDVDVLLADVTALPDGPTFGLVLLPASLLNELADADARVAALRGARRRCAEDGLVAMHLLNPWWLARLTGRSQGHLHADDGRGSIDVVIDAGTLHPWVARRQATLTYAFPDGAVLIDHLDAAIVTPGELTSELADAGLEPVEAYGPHPPDGVAEGDVAWHVIARPVRDRTGETSADPRGPGASA